ncbi:MAG: DNA repair protein RadA [Firmicutes bacterium ADurb.Bin182]|nr:MAG: DNA repair protein RadA [Firmicutes bacterium ADurb.Bin182]
MQIKKNRLIRMSDIETEQVRWLWYPFIPYGKVTIIQGDPGEGKTSFVLAMIALLTTGKPLPEETVAAEPIRVIYQSAEDGLADTIKPRLEASGADCSRVLVVDESDKELSLCDERLEQAVQETGAKLIVLDPLQAYLGDNVDVHRANEVRPIFKRLCAMVDRTGCAIILIGHMNKAQGLKSSYRGLGSIDFRAAARIVLLVGRLKSDPAVRVVAHDKSSLAPEGKSIAFSLDAENGFQWIGYCDVSLHPSREYR